MMINRKLLLSCLALTFLLLVPALARAQKILLLSPAQPTSADQITAFLSEPVCIEKSAAVVQGTAVYIYPDTSGCPPLLGPDPGLVTYVPFGPLAPGSYTIVVLTMGQVTDSRALFVQEPAVQLSLLKGRFTVSLTWAYADGHDGGSAQAVPIADASGYFWFFDPANLEITVKLIDGAFVNGHFWIFASSATDLPFTLSVVDTWLCNGSPQVCPTRTYKSMPGNRNIIDVNLFPS